MITKERLVTIGIMVVLVILSVTVTWYVMRPKGFQLAPSTSPKATIDETTTLNVVPKSSPNDNDLELTQSYKANINGHIIEAPIVTTGSTKDSNGTKAVLTQEVDMTPIVNTVATLEQDKAKHEYKKNWEIGTGIGVHNDDFYIPMELQRNYKSNTAIAIELHVDISGGINGYELKYKKMF